MTVNSGLGGALNSARQRITAADTNERAAKEKLESETRLFQTGESTNFFVFDTPERVPGRTPQRRAGTSRFGTAGETGAGVGNHAA